MRHCVICSSPSEDMCFEQRLIGDSDFCKSCFMEILNVLQDNDDVWHLVRR
jgi:hypothetical protein